MPSPGHSPIAKPQSAVSGKERVKRKTCGGGWQISGHSSACFLKLSVNSKLWPIISLRFLGKPEPPAGPSPVRLLKGPTTTRWKWQKTWGRWRAIEGSQGPSFSAKAALTPLFHFLLTRVWCRSCDRRNQGARRTSLPSIPLRVGGKAPNN